MQNVPTMQALVAMECFVILHLLFTETVVAMTTRPIECDPPEGVANAYIITDAPYYVGGLVRYACLPGFSMTGTPSQQCTVTQEFTGDPPVCNEIDMTATHENSQTVSVNVKKAKGFDLSDPTSVLAFLLLLLFLLLLVAAIIAALIFLCCRVCRGEFGHKEPAPKRVVPQKQVRRVQVVEKGEASPILSPRQVNFTEVNVQRHMVRRASNVSNQDLPSRRQSVNNFHELVMRVVHNNRKKEIGGKWMPHAKPVRNINTSTK